MRKELIHFHQSDERFCGTRQKLRRFTMDENEVTCPRCKANDCLELTPQGLAYVQELEAAQNRT